MPPTLLSDVPVGGRARVQGVLPGAPRSVILRLLEMGLLPGTEVSVTRVAPLGDPLQLRLRGYSLSIRRREARSIEVAPLAPPAPPEPS